MRKIAAVTMVYNEPEYLPIWCQYYGKVFGPENCFIVDHGTSDGSTDALNGFNVLRIPRSPKDNDKRTRFISAFCTSLLEWYEGFVHTDVDEIIVHDPARYTGLPDLIERVHPDFITAIGFDVHHDPLAESDLDLSRPVTWQRQWMRFSSSMCKPVLGFKPVSWAPGFHSANCALKFADIYLFHLRYFDKAVGLTRLGRTRNMAWARSDAGSHQRIVDDEFVSLMERTSRLPRIVAPSLSPETDPLKSYLERVLASEKDFRTTTYTIDLHIFGSELLEIPRKFVGQF